MTWRTCENVITHVLMPGVCRGLVVAHTLSRNPAGMLDRQGCSAGRRDFPAGLSSGCAGGPAEDTGRTVTNVCLSQQAPAATGIDGPSMGPPSPSLRRRDVDGWETRRTNPVNPMSKRGTSQRKAEKTPLVETSHTSTRVPHSPIHRPHHARVRGRAMVLSYAHDQGREPVQDRSPMHSARWSVSIPRWRSQTHPPRPQRPPPWCALKGPLSWCALRGPLPWNALKGGPPR